MKVPLGWLRDYVPVTLTPEAMAKRLTMTGLEVVGIDGTGEAAVLDLEITPNRPDCLSILGVAREVAAMTGQRLKSQVAPGSRLKARGKRSQPRASSFEPPATVTIQIEDRTGCRRYIGRLLTGVRIAPSPGWMQRRLAACGVRPINNLVDITNYVLLELGQPLHAFDWARLAGGAIVVRRARPGEPITTLDGRRHALSTEDLVIADAGQAVAIAGVMGGTGSEVTAGTTAVLLESALFDPLAVRRTARRLGLASESSYRFERGVDPIGVETASRRAAGLIVELAGGVEVAVRDEGSRPSARRVVTLDVYRLERRLGVRLDPPWVRTSLARLGCRVASAGGGRVLTVTPPSFRLDLQEDVDLHEEVARLFGYDRLPERLPAAPPPAGEPASAYWRMLSLRCLCASLGLVETVSWSLVSETDLAHIGHPVSEAVRLTNPLSQDHAYLRPSLLLGLLRIVRRNQGQGAQGVRIFEAGNVMRRAAEVEELRLGIALSGIWLRDWRGSTSCDFWILKGIIEALAARLCSGALQFANGAEPWGEPGAPGALVRLSGAPAGIIGQVSQRVAEAFDLKTPVWVAELSIPRLLGAARGTPHFAPLIPFPPAKRDLSFLVSQATPFEAVDAVIRDVAGKAAHRVELIDRFLPGAQAASGTHSLTVSIEYRDATRTLTSADVDALHQRIGQALVARCGATLR